MNETNHDDLSAYLYILMVSICAGISGFLFGYDTGVIAGALHLISTTFGLTSEDYALKEMIVASVPAGALIGAIVSSTASDSIGRRNSIIAASIVFTLGTAVVALGMKVHAIIAGRLLMGFAVGLSAMIVPMYLSEVSPPRIRGAVVFLFQLAITVGLMSAFVVNYLFAAIESWRWMFAVAVVPSIVLGITMLTLPDSPRWLVLRGREDEAKTNLRRLRGSSDIANELSDIKDSVSRTSGGLRVLFTARFFPLVVITVGLFEFQQLTGINTVFYYAPTIFEAGGFSDKAGALLASVALGCMNVIATLLGVCLVDIVGRRKLLSVGFLGMIVCLGVLGAAFNGWLGDPILPSRGDNIRILMIASALIYVFFFAISLGGVPYVLMAELFPLRVRGAGMATASCANWGTNLVISGTFLTFVNRWGLGNTFWMYMALTFIGFVFAYFLVPETKGRSLEGIEEDLYSRKS
jgi:sugar porter (SP) family MFS transporter